jgi:signal transduction histidine kinase
LPVDLGRRRSRALADRLAASRTAFVADLERRLIASGSSIGTDAEARGEVVTQGESVLDDVVRGLRDGRLLLVNTNARLMSRQIGIRRAARQVLPSESLAAATAVFDAVMAVAADAAAGETPVAAAELASVAVVANHSLTVRVREGAASYGSFLLRSIHEAQVQERHRIARELHDHVGHRIGVAFRHMELHGVYRDRDPTRAGEALATSQDAVREALVQLRHLAAGLQLDEPMDSIEKALRRFLETAGLEGVHAEVSVNGDEAWVPPEVRDQVYLMTREALRNAIQHSGAATVLAEVDITPHQLLATVDDDGGGFDVERALADGSAGLASMHDRARLVAGRVRVTSRTGAGTRVEILVPLVAEER